MDKVLYRNNNAFGDNVRKPLDVITYEVYELGNSDILEYCTEHYALSSELRNDIDDIIDNIDDIDEEDVITVIKKLLNELNVLYGKPIKEVIWLASLDAVNDLYDGEEENSDIQSYSVEDAIILSNLGYDGLLFGFFERPKELDENYKHSFKLASAHSTKKINGIYFFDNRKYIQPKAVNWDRINTRAIENKLPILEKWGIIEFDNDRYNNLVRQIKSDVLDVIHNKKCPQLCSIGSLDNVYVLSYETDDICDWLDKLYILIMTDEHGVTEDSYDSLTVNGLTISIDNEIVEISKIEDAKLKNGTISLEIFNEPERLMSILHHELKYLYDLYINKYAKQNIQFNSELIKSENIRTNLNLNDRDLNYYFSYKRQYENKINLHIIFEMLIYAVYFMDRSEITARLTNSIKRDNNDDADLYTTYKYVFEELKDNLSVEDKDNFNKQYIKYFKEIYNDKITSIDVLLNLFIKRIDNLFLKQYRKHNG